MYKFRGSTIFVAGVDQSIHSALRSLAKNFCFVDNFLVIFDGNEHGCNVVNLLKVFRECGLGLKFTREIAKENELQFQDLSLRLLPGHTS